MIKTEFGIIDQLDKTIDYEDYDPERYHCVYIDDERYIDDQSLDLRGMALR